MTPMFLPNGVSIREMTVDDIAAGLTLCRASRWNQTEQDWRFFLTAASWRARRPRRWTRHRHGRYVSVRSIHVDLDGARRSRGSRQHVGTALLHRGLELAGADATARLDATPLGEAIYRKIGFADEYRLARWFLDVKRRPSLGDPARGRSRVRIGRRYARWTSVHSAPHALACSNVSLRKLRSTHE